jgi:1-deoxy-D-xylulose-5-phosphate reductoisomerase
LEVAAVKRIILLGSTGSIGVSTLEVVDQFKDEFSVAALVAGKNTERLIEQAHRFSVKRVGVGDRAAAKAVKRAMPKVKVFAGPDGIADLVAETEAEMVVAAIVGEAGLVPSFRGLETGKDLALANKEAMVMAGALFNAEARRRKRRILPIDSEHCALHQCLRGGKRGEVEKLILTASGGPFLKTKASAFASITVKDALRHPTWSMGSKITIDSATLGNKALEVIEAHFLFGFPAGSIEVVIHPQSQIHSMVLYRDGSVLAQVSPNDMKFPIQYALAWPRRLPSPFGRVRFPGMTFTFLPVDGRKFPLLPLGYEALRSGGGYPMVFSLANELAVLEFLQGRIGFLDIAAVVRRTLERWTDPRLPDLPSLLEAAERARALCREEIARTARKVN